MDSSTIHILTFSSQDSLHAKIKGLIIPYHDILGIWMGECIEHPEQTFVVVAGLPGGLDSSRFSGLTPKRQQRTEMSVSALAECLNAPVTEIASTILKSDCDPVEVVSLIDEAMQTVLDADDCTAAVWKIGSKEVLFFVGWRFLEAHERYHEVIFANPPDCIKQLPGFIDSNIVYHVAFNRLTR